MLDDWSLLDGDEHYPAPTGGIDLSDQNLVEVVDWKAAGVDITVEYASGEKLGSSTQGYLGKALNRVEFDVVYCREKVSALQLRTPRIAPILRLPAQGEPLVHRQRLRGLLQIGAGGHVEFAQPGEQRRAEGRG
ncbi:hypothetical protein SAMN05444678_107176 [Sphingomonas sp. YR710]|nr:hypothetical protein SAMN05444678_107176 [Sphingomonas sp. YR710]